MDKETEGKNSLPLPPGTVGLPLIGETLSFLLDPQFVEKRFRKYGKIFKTQIFGQPALFTFGSENNRFFLMNDKDCVQVKLPPSTEALFGPLSLSVQVGDTHKSRRQILYQAFQPRALDSYFLKMQRTTQTYLIKWQKMGQVEWYKELQSYTFDVACQFLLGLDHASSKPLKTLYETWAKGLFSFNTIKLPWTRFGQAWDSRQQLREIIEQIIKERLSQTEGGSDALGILLQATDELGNRLSTEEVQDQILGMLFAGYGTLSSALTSFCLLMTQYPEVLEKVREEQQQIENLSTPDQLKQMPYLEQVLKEVLRTMTPVGSGFRQVIQDCEFEGYRIPKGWMLFYQITQTHQDPQVYSNPHQFEPERFSETRAEGKEKPFSYLPFGGGIRECLGKEFARLEMKLFAAMLVRSYQWELLSDQSLEMDFIPVPHPKDGLKVKIKPL